MCKNPGMRMASSFSCSGKRRGRQLNLSHSQTLLVNAMPTAGRCPISPNQKPSEPSHSSSSKSRFQAAAPADRSSWKRANLEWTGKAVVAVVTFLPKIQRFYGGSGPAFPARTALPFVGLDGLNTGLFVVSGRGQTRNAQIYEAWTSLRRPSP